MKGTVPMPIRSRINEVIEQKGFKKKWVAQQLGVSQSYFSQMIRTDENGILKDPPNSEYLLKLALVLGCKVEEIVEYVKEE